MFQLKIWALAHVNVHINKHPSKYLEGAFVHAMVSVEQHVNPARDSLATWKASLTALVSSSLALTRA
jgi:hypothetical protein